MWRYVILMSSSQRSIRRERNNLKNHWAQNKTNQTAKSAGKSKKEHQSNPGLLRHSNENFSIILTHNFLTLSFWQIVFPTVFVIFQSISAMFELSNCTIFGKEWISWCHCHVFFFLQYHSLRLILRKNPLNKRSRLVLWRKFTSPE